MSPAQLMVNGGDSVKKVKKSKRKSLPVEEVEEKEVVVKEEVVVKKEETEVKKKPKKRKNVEVDNAESKKRYKVGKEEKEEDENVSISQELAIAKKNSITFDDNQEQETNTDTKGDTMAEDLGSLERFQISDFIKDKLKKMGISCLFPVQYESFEHITGGHDLILQARTGSGKTLAFTLPLVEKLNSREGIPKQKRTPSILVLAPTRELSKQVAECFEGLCTHKVKVLCVYGGTPVYPQQNALQAGVDIVVGTPGRVQDLINREVLILSDLTHVILDEVDRMLDMGFAHDVDQILSLRYADTTHGKPQTLFFSATLPDWVQKTASKYLGHDYKVVDLIKGDDVRTSKTVQHLAIQSSYQDRASAINSVLRVYSGGSNGGYGDDGSKEAANGVAKEAANGVAKEATKANQGRAIIFCKTKRDADELAVSPELKISAEVIHGDIPQDKREMVLKGFREGRYRCLIATDVAARGLDIPEVDLVIQCSPPQDVESYIHRSGRTGRAGRVGSCVLFYKRNEEWELRALENKTGITFKRIPVPSTLDLLKASADDAIRVIDSVSKEASTHFEGMANEMLGREEACVCLSRALAVISGFTEVKQRSLLNNREGCVTYTFRSVYDIRHMTYVFNALKRFMSESLTKKVNAMRFCKDHKGVVFDIPSDIASEFESSWKDGDKDTLAKTTTLPELDGSMVKSNGRGGYSNNRGGGGGFRGRGGGYNRGGGDGGGSNGFRGRGGGGFNRSSAGFHGGGGGTGTHTTF